MKKQWLRLNTVTVALKPHLHVLLVLLISGSPFHLKALLKGLIFSSGKPLIICEDSVTFTKVMATFHQYEQYVSTLYRNTFLFVRKDGKMPVVPVSRILIASFGKVIICLWLSFYIQAKSGSSHAKDVIEEMNCRLAQTFAQDFPFYLVVAYRMYK